MASLKELLKQLSELSAPTGDEERVAAFMEREFKRHGFEVKRDLLGNVIARKGKGRKVLVAAHMDEIGLAVTAVTKEGFVKFAKVGGVYDGNLCSARVVLHAQEGKRVPGVIGMKPPHLLKEEERKRLVEHDQMFIDVGAKDKKEVEKRGVRPGTLIAFDSQFVDLGNDIVMGKAFDDRVGCAILLKLAEELKTTHGCDLHLVGTVREETGLWGAGASAFAIEPDLAIAVDVTFAGGTPDLPEDKVPVKLGEGVEIGVIEGSGCGLIVSPKLLHWIEGVARKKHIKYQLGVHEGGRTDASRMQYTKAGFLAVSLGVPTRYIHGQNELLSVRDADQTKELVKAVIQEFKHYK